MEELIPDACEALYVLRQQESDIGYVATNKLFETWGSTWFALVSQHNFDAAALHWISILDPVRRWETKNGKHIHKGTPYYFLAASYLYSSNFDLGFRYLFDAIKEDEKASQGTNNPQSYKSAPAYMLASLVENDQNYLYREIVSPARFRIEQFLATYNRETQTSMAMMDIDARFLNNSAFEFAKLYFDYVLLHLIKLEQMWNSREPQNDFMKMRNRDILLDLCLVIDELLRTKFPSASGIGDGVFSFLSSKHMLNALESNAGTLNQNLQPMISGTPYPSPDVIVPALLDLTLMYRTAAVTKEMSWLLLAWHLRNYAAHNLTPRQVLIDRYAEIVQSLMNGLLLCLE